MKELLEYKLFEIAGFSLSVYSLILIVLIFLGARSLVYIFKRFLKKRADRLGMDLGRQESFSLLFQYVIWLAAIVLILGAVGIKLTFLLLGSSALLIGLGLGLQTIFSDIVSGIFLLFEGTIEIGDVVEVNGMVGIIEEIGLRTSKFRNRDDKIMIIPNHHFINEKVINWTHNERHARFAIQIGVSYHSDMEIVRKLLIECAMNDKDVITDKTELLPDVRMTGFGDNAVNFELLFYSENLFRIETTKSNLRFAIWHALKKHEVEIPFPQMELHLRNVPQSNPSEQINRTNPTVN